MNNVLLAPDYFTKIRELNLEGEPLYVGPNAHRFDKYIGTNTYRNGTVWRVISVIDNATIEVKRA